MNELIEMRSEDADAGSEIGALSWQEEAQAAEEALRGLADQKSGFEAKFAEEIEAELGEHGEVLP